jgi:hypothetical protein
MAEIHGPAAPVTLQAEWFQLTYDLLRAAEDGETVAWYNHHADTWSMLDGTGPFSDIVISTEGGK